MDLADIAKAEYDTKSLTDLERRFFNVLARERGKCVSRELLYKDVWNITFETGTNRIDRLVSRLRSKGVKIETHKGTGYSLIE